MPHHHVRFAPSPTGDLHLGHVYAALYGWHRAQNNPDRFHLRIDDLDHTRCKSAFIGRHCDDLSWLGIRWTSQPLYQSKRLQRYQTALEFLKKSEVIYPCYLSRAEVANLLSAPQEGTDLRHVLSTEDKQLRHQAGQSPAWRLDMAQIAKNISQLSWHDAQKGTQIVRCEEIHDPIIARRDIGTSYDLSVVLDDYDSGITLVTRGEDLFTQTNIHRILQHLLSIPTPMYDHHQLIRDEDGKRLAKRDDARSLAQYRLTGASPDDILALLPAF